MIGESVLRNQRKIDIQIQKQRQERTKKMMNKVYDAKITTKEKPYIHLMYQNYHKTFCNKFKNKYMEEVKQAYAKASQLSNLSRNLKNQSVIQGKSISQASDQSNILDQFNQDSKKASSEIRNPTEIKKIGFSSEIKTSNVVNEMKKKKIHEEAQAINVSKNSPNKQEVVVQQEKLIAAQPLFKVGPKILIKSENKPIKQKEQKEIKKQKSIKEESKPNAIGEPKIQQIKFSLKQEKKVQVKSQSPEAKKQTLNKEKFIEQDYQQVQQEDSPSFYSLQQKNEPIQQSRVLVTKSQIHTSTQQAKVKNQIKSATSQIIKTSSFDQPINAKTQLQQKQISEKVEQQQEEKHSEKNIIKIQQKQQKHEVIEISQKIGNSAASSEKIQQQESKQKHETLFILKEQIPIQSQQQVIIEEKQVHQVQNPINAPINQVGSQSQQFQQAIITKKDEIPNEDILDPSAFSELIMFQSQQQKSNFSQNIFSQSKPQPQSKNYEKDVSQLELDQNSNYKAEIQLNEQANAHGNQQVLTKINSAQDENVISSIQEDKNLIDNDGLQIPPSLPITFTNHESHSNQSDDVEHKVDQIVNNFIDLLQNEPSHCHKCQFLIQQNQQAQLRIQQLSQKNQNLQKEVQQLKDNMKIKQISSNSRIIDLEKQIKNLNEKLANEQFYLVNPSAVKGIARQNSAKLISQQNNANKKLYNSDDESQKNSSDLENNQKESEKNSSDDE